MPQNEDFDATNIEPAQGGSGIHPEYKGPAVIAATAIKPTAAGDGGMFVVTFETPLGQIDNRYNIWNKSDKAKEIAHKELSALSHATGVLKFTFKDDGRALIGQRCVIEVGLQGPRREKGPDNTMVSVPNTNGYTEFKKVFDMSGNEPGKAPAGANGAAPPPAGFGQQQASPPAAPPPVANGWGAQPQGGPIVESGIAPQGGWGTGGPAPATPPAAQGGWGGAGAGGPAPWGQK